MATNTGARSRGWSTASSCVGEPEQVPERTQDAALRPLTLAADAAQRREEERRDQKQSDLRSQRDVGVPAPRRRRRPAQRGAHRRQGAADDAAALPRAPHRRRRRARHRADVPAPDRRRAHPSPGQGCQPQPQPADVPEGRRAAVLSRLPGGRAAVRRVRVQQGEVRRARHCRRTGRGTRGCPPSPRARAAPHVRALRA